jgi:hypothetical protein
MKKIILIASLLSLNGCAFDSLMSNLNGSLDKTNKVLSGDLSRISSKATLVSDKKDISLKSTSLIDSDCDKWAKNSYEWHMNTGHKTSQSNLKQMEIFYKKENEIIKAEGKLIRLCMQDDHQSAHGSNPQNPNPYLDKLGKDGFYH